MPFFAVRWLVSDRNRHSEMLGHGPRSVPADAWLLVCTVSHPMFVQLQMSLISMRVLEGVGTWLVGRPLMWTLLFLVHFGPNHP